MTVYIIQDQKWVDPKAQHQLKPKFDFELAREFGELEFLLKPSASPFDLKPVLLRLHQVLQNFSSSDYLLLTGNPILLGVTVAVAADYNDGNVAMLQWSGAKQSYIPVFAKNIFQQETDCEEGNEET
jgi:hypothetical protein